MLVRECLLSSSESLFYNKWLNYECEEVLEENTDGVISCHILSKTREGIYDDFDVKCSCEERQHLDLLSLYDTFKRSLDNWFFLGIY